MTPEQMVARLLYRDGLMLVIDKPAGFAVHKGPKGGETSRTISTRCVSGCRARRRSRTGSTARRRVPGARPPSQGAGRARTPVQSWLRRQDLLGAGRGRTGAGGRPHRPAARPQGRNARVVDEARPRRPDGDDDLEGVGPRRRRSLPRLRERSGGGRQQTPCRQQPPSASGAGSNAPHLAGAGAAHRPHPSAARALRGDGLAIVGDAITEPRRGSAAPACTCMPARWWCRCTRTAHPLTSPRRCRCICTSRCWPAGWDGELFKLVD